MNEYGMLTEVIHEGDDTDTGNFETGSKGGGVLAAGLDGVGGSVGMPGARGVGGIGGGPGGGYQHQYGNRTTSGEFLRSRGRVWDGGGGRGRAGGAFMFRILEAGCRSLTIRRRREVNT